MTAVTLLPVDFYYRYMSVCHNIELSNKKISILVFVAYFVTWLHTFPNSYNFMVFSDTPEAEEYNKELERFEMWNGSIPTYAATVLVRHFANLQSTTTLSNVIYFKNL